MRNRSACAHPAIHISALVVIVLTGVIVQANQARSTQVATLQLIPGTTLRIVPPHDWRIVKPTASGAQLAHIGEPAYEIQVGQTQEKSYGRICIDFIGSLMAIEALKLRRVERPVYVPDVYAQSIADGGNIQLACVPTGTGALGVSISLRKGAPKPQVLTPLLLVLADAAVKESAVVSSPRQLELPRLGIAITPKIGSWGHHTRTDSMGTHDVVQRAATPRGHEIAISVWRFPANGRCEALMQANTLSKSATRVSQRQYGGVAWHGDAIEQFPPPFKGLQAYLCRDASDGSMLLARLDYELSTVRDDDREVIRTMLDEIGDAYQRRVK